VLVFKEVEMLKSDEKYKDDLEDLINVCFEQIQINLHRLDIDQIYRVAKKSEELDKEVKDYLGL
jgi:hypothetical protein